MGTIEVLAVIGDQGLASTAGTADAGGIVYRGGLSIPAGLLAAGWSHIGDPDSSAGAVIDAYQAANPAQGKLFRVTAPGGATSDFVHPLSAGELFNNSFVAVAPSGQWMVSGEWDVEHRLLVLPAPLANPAAADPARPLPLAGDITLDHPARYVQGCDFTSPTQLLCATDDPGTDLWPTAYQLLEVDLPNPLDGRPTTADVQEVGEIPTGSICAGPGEVEGVDYQTSTGTLRIDVHPPGSCTLVSLVYSYRR